jgi:transaldolase
MKFFLDSAILDEIRYAEANWAIDGITTNPRHIKTSGKPFYTVINEIALEYKGSDKPISVEINPHLDTAAGMIKAGEQLAALSPNFVIKIPCTEQGLIAAKYLTEKGVRCNVTLVFTVTQALQVARIGAYIVSPFVFWLERNGVDGVEYIRKIKKIYNTYGYKTEIIAAAVREGQKIAAFAEAGVDIVTAGFEVYKDSFYSPYTKEGVEFFCGAWDDTEEGDVSQWRK